MRSFTPLNRLYISIHAPSRERLSTRLIISLALTFQSALPRGSDRRRGSGLNAIQNFNPRSLAGATREIQAHKVSKVFQSTLPRGSDQTVAVYSPDVGYFNPRSLAGATNLQSVRWLDRHISIHAPSRERPGLVIVGNK
mgnify:CR=1 FL=1